MARIALNGLGRIGKLVLRDLIDTGIGGDIVLLNDPVGDAEQHALLMEFDSVHGRWKTPVSHEEDALILNGARIRLSHERTLEALPLAELGVNLVIDCTGVFKTAAKVPPYYAAGVKKVVVSAPVKNGGALNLVYGVNHHLYEPGTYNLITAASCTTNCLAPVVKVIHEGIGIKHRSITTIHDVTNTQTIVDRPDKDIRRARSALLNLIPTTCAYWRMSNPTPSALGMADMPGTPTLCVRPVLSCHSASASVSLSNIAATAAPCAFTFCAPWSICYSPFRRVATRPPMPRPLSNTTGACPASASRRTQASPAIPAPMMTMGIIQATPVPEYAGCSA